MKKVLMFILLLTALPMIASAQYDTLSRYDEPISPNSLFGSWGTNSENYIKLQPPLANFTIDSLIVYFYRQAGASPNVTIALNIYQPNGTPAFGSCGCTTGPGTLIRSYTGLAITGLAATTVTRRAFNLADTLLTGDFIIGIQYVSRSGGGTLYPSLLFDNNATVIPCCDQYWNYSAAPGVRDNEALFTNVPGPIYAGLTGTLSGAADPGHLLISTLGSMGGSVVDSTVTDTLILENDGGTSLTVTAIASSNPAFSTDGIGGGLVIAAGATTRLAVHFTPTTAGDQTTTLSFTDNVPASVVTLVDLDGTGIGAANLVDFQNWWHGTQNGDWTVERFAEPDPDANWELFYTGQHAGGYTNVWARHFYTASGAPDVEDILGSGWLPEPVGNSIQINFREQVIFSADYVGHALAISDTDSVWTLGAELIPAGISGWVGYPVTYYATNIVGPSRIGFYYTGVFADVWDIDDILFQSVPQLPPVIQLVDPKGDEFTNGGTIYANVFDTNDDALTVQCWVETAAATFVAHAMSDTGGTGDYCIDISDFLNGSGTYRYYITATDNDGETRMPSTGHYSFDAQSQVGASEILYHNGTEFNGHYYIDPLDEEAVRFTPSAYPFYLTAAKVNILNFFPDGAHQPIIIKVYDDDGASGLPGTLLLQDTTGSIGNSCSGLTGFSTIGNVVINNPILINSGTFYISIRNLVSATQTEREAWALDDSTGSGVNYFYDASANTWSLIADTTQGDIMMSALGYVGPDAPVLTIYGNTGGSSVNVYVDNVVGTIPSTNLYTSPDGVAAYTLVAGSPFTTSPITVNTSSKSFFEAKEVFGPVDLSRELPNDEPVLPTTSVVTNALSSVSVSSASASDAQVYTTDMEIPLSAKDVPSLMIRNEVTGEYKMVPMTQKLGKAKSVETVRMTELRGPVRSEAAMPSKGGFDITPIYTRN